MARAIGLAELDAARARARLLDVRESDVFAAGHLAGAGHVPLAQLAPRSSELPSRGEEVLVVAEDRDQALRGAAALEAMGYERVCYLEAPLAEVPGGLGDRGPAARLWSPAPFLSEIEPKLPRGRALDVAAGSCRNAVFLATRGFEVEAVDLAPEALARGHELAAREGVMLVTWQRDLEREPRLPESRYQVVVCFRFLFRPLFPALAQALAPGGHLVYETYREGARRYERPRRARFLLKPGELRTAFAELEVLHYSEPEPEGGPATARLWARRP